MSTRDWDSITIEKWDEILGVAHLACHPVRARDNYVLPEKAYPK